MVNLYDPAAVAQKGYDVGHKRGSKVAKLRSRGATFRAEVANNRATAELQKNLAMLERRGFGTAQHYAEGFRNGWENATGDQSSEVQEEIDALNPNDPAGNEQLLGAHLDEVLEMWNQEPDQFRAPDLFVDRVRSDAKELQTKGVSVERIMMAAFANVRLNPETQPYSDEDLWQIVAIVYAQLIREGSIRRH